MSLSENVIRLIEENNLSEAYEHCFSELTAGSESKEAEACLALLSMIVGNEELAEWYLSKSGQYIEEVIGNQIYRVLLNINDINLSKKWDNYRRVRNQQELKRMAVTAPLCTGNVLEIGCANGDLSVFIAAHGATLYGIDIDPVAVDLARYKVAKLGIDTCRFQVGNGYQLNLPDQYFDTVVVAEVLEHVNDPKRIIKEAYRVCKPGGKVIISVPNRYSIPDPDHLNIFSKQLLNGLVEYAIDCSLEWIDDVPSEWILGVLTKPVSDNLPGVEDHIDICSLFLPPLYSLPSSDKLVSVIITTYNRPDYLFESIESVFAQTHKNLEVILVDDGSEIPVKELLTPYMDRIKYIYKENGGKASALNEAIKHVNGEFIWVFDDDDIALPLKLELQLKRFQVSPELGMVHTRSINFNDTNGQVVSIHDLSPVRVDLDFKLLMRGCFVHGPTVLFRRSCLDQLIGWDTQLTRAQDYDFWLRLANLYKIDYLPVPTVLYRMHAASRGSANDPVEYSKLDSATAKYEQIIFRKLYQTIPINEMYREVFEADNITLMLEALLERAFVYAARGLLGEAKQDLMIVQANAASFGYPCFSGEAIQNIHKLAGAAVQNNWGDHDLVSSIYSLLDMITQKDV